MTLDTSVAATLPETRPAEPRPAEPRAAETRRITWFRPAIDIYENEDGLLVALDVPGVPQNGFEITTESRTLTVSGVRSDGARGWKRAFELPTTLDAGKISARAENGVLFLTLPKAEAAKPRRITVS